MTETIVLIKGSFVDNQHDDENFIISGASSRSRVVSYEFPEYISNAAYDFTEVACTLELRDFIKDTKNRILSPFSSEMYYEVDEDGTKREITPDERWERMSEESKQSYYESAKAVDELETLYKDTKLKVYAINTKGDQLTLLNQYSLKGEANLVFPQLPGGTRKIVVEVRSSLPMYSTFEVISARARIDIRPFKPYELNKIEGGEKK